MRVTYRLPFAAVLLLSVAACVGDSTTAPAPLAPPLVNFSHDPPGTTAVDQSQPVAQFVPPFTFAIGGPSSQVLAQVFTAAVSGRLREIELPVACAAGRFRLELRDAPGGTPGISSLAAEVFGPGTLPTGFPPTGEAIWTSLDIRPSPTITAGVQYAIVMSNLDAPTGSCGIFPGPLGDPYAGGNGYFFDVGTSSWVNISLGNGREDLPFFTYVRP